MEATEIDRKSSGNRHPAYALSYAVHALENNNLHLTGGVCAYKCKFTISEITDGQTNRQDLVWGNSYEWEITLGSSFPTTTNEVLTVTNEVLIVTHHVSPSASRMERN